MKKSALSTRHLFYEPVHKLRELLDKRELSAVEMTNLFLEHIRELNPILNSVLTIAADSALKDAARADERLRGKGAPPGKLTGIPILVKDAIVTKSIATTAGSKILENYVPPYDATVISRLRSQDAVIVGKSNLDEFSMGSSTENSAYGPARNPWNLKTVPGGSSGGSAAAVAVGQAPLALGGDTGGSVRQPASLCGVVGMKPTYGLVSRYGLIAFASSLEQISPLARTVRDVAALLEAIAGHDPRDATSLPVKPPRFDSVLNASPKPRKIGVPREYMENKIDPLVKDAFDAALQTLEDMGHTISEVSLPSSKNALSVYYIIAPSEASANLARYDGVRYGLNDSGDTAYEQSVAVRGAGFGEEVKRRIFLGTYSLSFAHYDEYYRKAQEVRSAISAEFDSAFQEVDIIASPTSPTTAFKIGERVADPLAMYTSDILTVPANIANVPAISVPCGFADGLPVGLQFIANRLQDDRVLKIAHDYQEATKWHTRHPSLEG